MVDVNGLTATFVVESMLDSAPYAVIAVHDWVHAVREDGVVAAIMPVGTTRCGCS